MSGSWSPSLRAAATRPPSPSCGRAGRPDIGCGSCPAGRRARSKLDVAAVRDLLEEARAYLAHPILGARLVECARALADLEGRTAQDVFGTVDAMQLRSSMTLFARAAPEDPLFLEVLDQYFPADEATDARLEGQAPG